MYIFPQVLAERYTKNTNATNITIDNHTHPQIENKKSSVKVYSDLLFFY